MANAMTRSLDRCWDRRSSRKEPVQPDRITMRTSRRVGIMPQWFPFPLGTRIFPLGTGIDWIPIGNREHGNTPSLGNTSGTGNTFFGLGNIGNIPTTVAGWEHLGTFF